MNEIKEFLGGFSYSDARQARVQRNIDSHHEQRTHGARDFKRSKAKRQVARASRKRNR